MPNWCNNELTITGPKKDRDRFVEHARSKNRHNQSRVLCEDQFIPYPKKYADQDLLCKKAEDEYQRAYDAAGMEKENNATNVDIIVYGKKWKAWHDAHPRPNMKDGYNSGGYEWCIKHWGTKWGFCEPSLHEQHCSLLYTFDTAWSPPVPLIVKMSEMFPTLTFALEWEEEGGQSGKFDCTAGCLRDVD